MLELHAQNQFQCVAEVDRVLGEYVGGMQGASRGREEERVRVGDAMAIDAIARAPDDFVAAASVKLCWSCRS